MIITQPKTSDEFEQMFRLNYQTFVDEIPQHQTNENKILVDKFHEKNRYFIAKDGDTVVGMICYSTKRPFSLDAKVADLDSFLPAHDTIAEVRLLSVQKEYRHGRLAYRLIKHLSHELLQKGIYTAVISGTTRQLSFYNKIGFIPFGNLVGTREAAYQPMYITLNDLRSVFKSY